MVDRRACVTFLDNNNEEVRCPDICVKRAADRYLSRLGTEKVGT